VLNAQIDFHPPFAVHGKQCLGGDYSVRHNRRGHPGRAEHIIGADLPSRLLTRQLASPGPSLSGSTTNTFNMTQVAPLKQVTVVTFDPHNEKQEHGVHDKSSLKQKLVVGVLYTLVSVGMLYVLVAAVSFVGDVFTLLLVLTRH
jgi:hypothetical protein